MRTAGPATRGHVWRTRNGCSCTGDGYQTRTECIADGGGGLRRVITKLARGNEPSS